VLETAAKRASGPLAWWRARGELLRDTIGAVTYTIVALLPPMVSNGVALGEFPPPHPGGTPAVLLALAQTLPLALRRRAPVVALAVIGSAFAAYQCLNYGQSFTTTGIILALYATGAHQRRFRLTLLAAVSAAYLVVALVLAGLHSPERPVDYVTFYLFLLGCWGAGTLVRSRQRAEAELRVRTAADAAAAERTRIARELHDVVTHHVTAMVIQADAATFLAESAPARVPGELGEISATGRRALTELRYLLGLLDTVSRPTPPPSPPGACATWSSKPGVPGSQSSWWPTATRCRWPTRPGWPPTGWSRKR
jgi:signal transduction histidine kinase